MGSTLATESRGEASATAERREDALPNDIPLSLKATLVDEEGVAYRDFRRGLSPKWWRVWAEIGLVYLVMAATLAGLVIWSPEFPLAAAAGIGGALVIGWAIHILNNFFHEAAHYNIVPGRARNDLAANLLMGWIFASSIALYRHVHLQHHRALGTTMDSENSYFDALGVRYLVEGLLGLSLLRSVRSHGRTDAGAEQGKGPRGGWTRPRLVWTLIGVSCNLGLAALLILIGSPAAAIAWLAGLLVVFPFLASIRQLLEHRSEQADQSVDYSRVDHGPVNRLFGDGPLASTLGAAGFNRHAIHHWEPQVSYTRLADIERYLLRTPVAPLIRERQTSYRDTFLRLLEL